MKIFPMRCTCHTQPKLEAEFGRRLAARDESVAPRRDAAPLTRAQAIETVDRNHRRRQREPAGGVDGRP